ncbi:MAG: hypothetical protein K6E54_03560 [Bacteroidaceae bacterium]|nr:hypothetical protein [Bacteroidaceae bacterium]
MIKKTCYVSALLLALSSSSYAQITSDTEYVIQNVESGYYLGGANNWGTHAALTSKPQRFTIVGSENVYTLDSHQYNSETSHYLATNLFVDGDATNWTIQETSDGTGIFTIENGGQYLTGNGKNENVSFGSDKTSSAAQWKFITIADVVASQANATAENPVDVTAFIKNPEFKRNSYNTAYPTWTVTSADGTNSAQNYKFGDPYANCAESWHSNNGFDFSQEMTELQPGVYRLDAQAFYRQEGEDTQNIPYIYANNEYSNFLEISGTENSMAEAYTSFLNKAYSVEPIYVSITSENNTLKIGAHGDNLTLWNIWGEFSLTYYGDVTINEVKNASYIVSYRQALADALAIDQTAKMKESTLEALKDTLSAYPEKSVITTDATSEDIERATKALLAVTNEAKNSIKGYASAQAAALMVKELLENNNFYTTETYAKFYADYDRVVKGLAADSLDNTFALNYKTKVFGSGHKTENTVDDLLLSTWGTSNYDSDLCINTWSTEGDNKTNGSGMVVPFFEYWVDNAKSLNATTKTGTLTGLENGTYEVSALVRVRKSDSATDDATGITMSVNGGDATDVCAGSTCDDGTQFFYGTFKATGEVIDGTLNVSFNVADGNNINWLSFKNIKYTKIEKEEEKLTYIDYTSYIVNSTLTDEEAGWTIVNGKNYDASGVVKFSSGATNASISQVIKLPAGQYKLTAKACFRYGNTEQAEYEAINSNEYNTHLVKLTAVTPENTYAVNVQNRYEGASETNYSESGTVLVNNLYVPNSSDAVKAWFNAGKYANELKFTVENDSEVTIAITKETADGMDYTVVGDWTLERGLNAEEVLSISNIATTSENNDVKKIIRNGQIVIVKGGKTYNVTGALLK